LETTRRILSIDGGGIKGVFPASFLATVEDQAGEPLGRYFDLIAGTSTGGIIALGLGLGIPAKTIRDLYLELGPSIFPAGKGGGLFKSIKRGKWDPAPLKVELIKLMGDRELGEAQTRLVIPAFHPYSKEVYIFKTRHHPRFEFDYKEKVVDVAMATSAAPSYFPEYVTETGMVLSDGGVWAANPLGMSVVEAVGVLNWPRETIKAVSLGCTLEMVGREGFKWWRPRSSFMKYARYSISLLMSGQAHGSLGTANILIGSENVFRFDPPVPTGRYQLDNAENIAELDSLGQAEARKALPELKKHFLGEPADPFVPCPMPA
jgi:predicted acylesterase/phospholipase RssA